MANYRRFSFLVWTEESADHTDETHKTHDMKRKAKAEMFS